MSRRQGVVPHQAATVVQQRPRPTTREPAGKEKDRSEEQAPQTLPPGLSASPAPGALRNRCQTCGRINVPGHVNDHQGEGRGDFYCVTCWTNWENKVNIKILQERVEQQFGLLHEKIMLVNAGAKNVGDKLERVEAATVTIEEQSETQGLIVKLLEEQTSQLKRLEERVAAAEDRADQRREVPPGGGGPQAELLLETHKMVLRLLSSRDEGAVQALHQAHSHGLAGAGVGLPLTWKARSGVPGDDESDGGSTEVPTLSTQSSFTPWRTQEGIADAAMLGIAPAISPGRPQGGPAMEPEGRASCLNWLASAVLTPCSSRGQ